MQKKNSHFTQFLNNYCFSSTILTNNRGFNKPTCQCNKRKKKKRVA